MIYKHSYKNTRKPSNGKYVKTISYVTISLIPFFKASYNFTENEKKKKKQLNCIDF